MNGDCFDEQPDGDPHGECAAEIHRLQALLLEGARRIEALKRECGTSPESAIAIQNSRYMGVSGFLRSAARADAEGDLEGYRDAFYRIASALSIPAQNLSPKLVFEQEMFPKIAALVRAAETAEIANAAKLAKRAASCKCGGWSGRELADGVCRQCGKDIDL